MDNGAGSRPTNTSNDMAHTQYFYRKTLHRGKAIVWMVDSVRNYDTRKDAVIAAHISAAAAEEGLINNGAKPTLLNEPFGATIWYKDTEGNCCRMDFDVLEIYY